MLVLKRYEDEDVYIETPTGDRVRIVVVSVGPGRQARIGIDADKDKFRIIRGELTRPNPLEMLD